MLVWKSRLTSSTSAFTSGVRIELSTFGISDVCSRSDGSACFSASCTVGISLPVLPSITASASFSSAVSACGSSNSSETSGLSNPSFCKSSGFTSLFALASWAIISSASSISLFCLLIRPAKITRHTTRITIITAAPTIIPITSGFVNGLFSVGTSTGALGVATVGVAGTSTSSDTIIGT